MQARSTASVDAILQATIQVLLKEGKAKLTTTRVAHRAGVSVGTLYQYFPNKSALLQAVLKAHLDGVALAVQAACDTAQGAPLAKIADAITSAFVQAKFSNIHASAALYAVSDDVEGKRLGRAMHARGSKAMAAVFQTARDKTIRHPDVVAATLLSAMAGVSRTMLEKENSRAGMLALEKELKVMARAYLEASAENP